MISNNKAIIEERAARVIKSLERLPPDSIVYTTTNGLSLTPVEVVIEVKGRTTIGCAILDHFNLESFFKTLGDLNYE